MSFLTNSESDFMSSNNAMSVSVIASETFQSMGDALRELDSKAIIKSDFILINGDSIGNLPLKEIRAQHKLVLFNEVFELIFLNFFVSLERIDRKIRDVL